MFDRDLVRGIYLAVIALAFGLTAWGYPHGTLGRAGPGFFPLVISGALLLIAILTIIRSRFKQRQPFEFNYKNIGLILLGLGAFAGVSELINMIAGILVMVFLVSYAGRSHSWSRSLKVAAGLIAVAFAFQKLLGLNLPLY